jgi:hypothetical protein
MKKNPKKRSVLPTNFIILDPLFEMDLFSVDNFAIIEP